VAGIVLLNVTQKRGLKNIGWNEMKDYNDGVKDGYEECNKKWDKLIGEAREIVNYTNRDAKDFTRKIKSQILVEKISKLKKSGEDA